MVGLDLIASNWGKNSRYQASPQRPWRLHYGDLNGMGQVELVEGRWEPSMNREVPERGWRMVRAGYPFLQERIQSFEAYARAGLEEIYGERYKRAACGGSKHRGQHGLSESRRPLGSHGTARPSPVGAGFRGQCRRRQRRRSGGCVFEPELFRHEPGDRAPGRRTRVMAAGETGQDVCGL
jgi:hypothetical protein